MSQMLKILQTPPELIKKADVLEDIGKWMDENPLASKMLIGGGIGALGGAAFSGGRNTLMNAIGGGLLGAGGGALYHHFSQPSAPAPNPGGGEADANKEAPKNEGGETAAPTPTPVPTAQEGGETQEQKVVTNPTSTKQEPVTPTTSKQEEIPTNENDLSNWEFYGKDFYAHPELYDKANKVLERMGPEAHSLFVRMLRRTGAKFDKTQFTKTPYHIATAKKTLNSMKNSKDRATYVLRMLQMGYNFKPQSTYKNGAPLYIGDPQVDHLLSLFYGVEDQKARQNAIGWYNVNTLEDLIKAVMWNKKNHPTGIGDVISATQV